MEQHITFLFNNNRSIEDNSRCQLNGNEFLFKIEEFANNGKKYFAE